MWRARNSLLVPCFLLECRATVRELSYKSGEASHPSLASGQWDSWLWSVDPSRSSPARVVVLPGRLASLLRVLLEGHMMFSPGTGASG